MDFPLREVGDLLHDTARRATEYCTRVPDRPVTPTAQAVAALAGLDEPLPRSGCRAEDVLARLDRLGSPATVATTGGRYFGFVTGGVLPAALAASWLATAWDQNAALSVMSPVAAALERVALRWVAEALGLPAGVDGGFVSGATMANLSGLAAARHRVLARAGWDVEADGLVGAPPVTVVVGDEVHSTVVKVLGLLGLGRRRLVAVPTDNQGRMRTDRLPAVTGPAIVCLQAGNVNSGASDPFTSLIAWARDRDAWVHVDGAFGLWAAASPVLAHLVSGVGGADSWATDGHKWLNVPYDCGIVLTRDPDALAATMAASAAYLPGTGREPMDRTPQASQRARGVEVWAALASLGRDGLADLVERCCRHARRFAEGLRAAGYEVANEVVLNQVVVRFGDDARTDRVLAAVAADGTCWCGPTTWQGRRGMRISVSSWATTDDDVERSLDAICRAAASVSA